MNGGFISEQIKEMGAVKNCQFPNCKIQGKLNSDHFHDGNKINTENYRGEICRGHNVLLSDLDKHPEWANPQELEYMKRRPYSKLTICISSEICP